jgi:hypothetical protein
VPQDKRKAVLVDHLILLALLLAFIRTSGLVFVDKKEQIIPPVRQLATLKDLGCLVRGQTLCLGGIDTSPFSGLSVSVSLVLGHGRQCDEENQRKQSPKKLTPSCAACNPCAPAPSTTTRYIVAVPIGPFMHRQALHRTFLFAA